MVDRISEDLSLSIFSFSVFHVFFEQYLTIARDSLHILGAPVPPSATLGLPSCVLHLPNNPRLHLHGIRLKLKHGQHKVKLRFEVILLWPHKTERWHWQGRRAWRCWRCAGC